MAAFVGLNLLGARTTGTAENVLVAVKILVLVLFGVGGVVYATTVATEPTELGFGQLASVSPLMAAGISFVAFQGWQLLFYDQESVKNSVETIRKAVYISIPVAVAIYVLVAVATYNLAPQALKAHPHTALKAAAETMLSVFGLASLGGLVIVASALFSTGSAINATLFSSGYFAKGLLSKDLLPDHVGDSSADGVPEKTLLGLGVVTAGFAAWGSLDAITSFASVAFIVVFGSTSYLAFVRRDEESVSALPPALGLVGCAGFLPVMLYHLYSANRETFVMVCVLAVAVVGVELLYFERELLAEEVREFESDVAGMFD